MRRVVAIPMAVILPLVLCGCGFEARRLDRQMEELCKKDGGVKVYQTVTLPTTYFEHDGRLKVSHSMAYGADAEFQRIGDDEYRIITKKVYIVGKGANVERGDGVLVRVHISIYRWRDRFLLSEYIWYDRGGGDGFTFGFQPSGSFCPKPRTDLLKSVFIKGE